MKNAIWLTMSIVSKGKTEGRHIFKSHSIRYDLLIWLKHADPT